MSLRARARIGGAAAGARAVVTALDCRSATEFARLNALARETDIAIVAVVEADDREWADVCARKRKTRRRNLKLERLDCSYGKLGRGAAIRYGLKCVNADAIAIVNIDEAISSESLAECFDLLESRSDLDAVFTYREQTTHRSPEARLRRLESKLFNVVVKSLFALRVRDVQAPIKVFRRAPMERVFENLRLYNHGFDADLLFNVRQLGLRFEEIETPWVPQYREWDVLGLAFGAVAALVFLRLVSSPLASLPGVALLGRHFWLPVKHRYRMLVFCWRDPRSPSAGGGEVYLFEQARAWARLGHEVTWLAQAFKGLPSEEVIEGVRIVRRGRSLLVFPCAIFWYLFRSGKQFDFLIDTMNGLPFFTPLFSLKPKAALIFHVHSTHFLEELEWPLGAIAAWVETKLVPFVYRRTRFITISRNSLEEMQRLRMSPLPIGLVHSGVSADFAPGAKSHAPTVLYVGRLRKYKQIRKLIDAVRTARASIPDIRLVIAGTGDDEARLRQYALGDAAIVFKGRVDEAEKRRLMREAWVFGMPSAIEGWGITVIEAAASGTPAVAFNQSALRDCIVHDVTGMLADDDDGFAAHIAAVLTDKKLRARLSAGALAWSSQFSWKNTALRMLEEIRIGQPWRAALEVEANGQVSIFDDRHVEENDSTMPSRELLSAGL